MNNKIARLINSGEYKNKLSNLVSSITRNCRCSDNESSTSAIFENELYFYIRKEMGIKLDFKKEVNVSNVYHTFGSLTERKSGKGRLDAVVNGLIIEYKHFSNLQNKNQCQSAVAQLEDYLNALKTNDGVEYSAILTDGVKIAFFQFTNEKLEHTAFSSLSAKDLDIIIRAILTTDTKKFTPSNIMLDFSINSETESSSRDLAVCLLTILLNNPTEKTKMLFSEWQALMHLSLEDSGKSNDIAKRRKDLSLIFQKDINSTFLEYNALYALQTTYAIIVKLIACKVIDKINFNEESNTYHDLTNITSAVLQEYISTVEDGYSYKNNNINNLLEGDFYSWYSDKNQWNEDLWKCITPIIKTIDSYSTFNFNIVYQPVDVFKDLYMSIIPKSIRHSMGEYFTPEWLAEYVINESIEIMNSANDDNEKTKKVSWKAIDPCCGSGIFILALIKKIVGKTKLYNLSKSELDKLRDEILARVCGIDINPLSVLSARVGYYLALLPLGNQKDIDIPIYLGDAAIIPLEVNVGESDCYQYSVTNQQLPFDVILPKSFVNRPDFLTKMCELQVFVNADDNTSIYNSLMDSFDDKDKNNIVLQDKIKSFADVLVELHEKNWDGIWVRIVSNFMLIARISNMDIIVGNPPWVKWEHLPEVYANKIKETCNIQHIFCNDGGRYGGTQLNICALIANMTATNWLSPKGVLAFLMPDSIMSQNSYEEFRNFYTDYGSRERLYLQKLDKWEKPLRPFKAGDTSVTQDFNTYYYQNREVDYSKGVPVTTISRNRKIRDDVLNQRKSFDEVKGDLVFGNAMAKQFSENSTAFSYVSELFDFSLIIGKTDYLYRTGVEYTPQELYMLIGRDKSPEKDHYLFSNKKFNRSKYKITDMPSDGWSLPTQYIYPMLTAPHIVPFGYTTNNEFCIVPYSVSDLSKPVPSKELQKTDKKLLLYLSRHKTIIEQQSERSKEMHRGEEFYSLAKIGPYTFSKYIVAARDNTKFSATVVNQEETPWGEIKQTICVKHTIIISQRTNGSFITENEAFYICGILNCDIVTEYIKNSFKSNGFSLNKSNIYLPKFDEKNSLHIQIVQLSKDASHKKIPIDKATKIISNLYIELCKKEKGEKGK